MSAGPRHTLPPPGAHQRSNPTLGSEARRSLLPCPKPTPLWGRPSVPAERGPWTQRSQGPASERHRTGCSRSRPASHREDLGGLGSDWGGRWGQGGSGRGPEGRWRAPRAGQDGFVPVPGEPQAWSHTRLGSSRRASSMVTWGPQPPTTPAGMITARPQLEAKGTAPAQGLAGPGECYLVGAGGSYHLETK